VRNESSACWNCSNASNGSENKVAILDAPPLGRANASHDTNPEQAV
jgi:hypothetical protein